MKIFQIIPTQLKNEVWNRCTVVEIFIVRAETQNDAREIVSLATKKSTRADIENLDTPDSPWYDPAFAVCENYLGNDFPEEGPKEILTPKILND